MTKYAFKVLTFCVWESWCREYRNSLDYSFKFSINLSYFKVMSLKERERERNGRIRDSKYKQLIRGVLP